MVERSGKAIALTELLTSPLTQRQCVAYHALVDEPGLFGRVVVAQERSAAAFAIDDGTVIRGIARIELAVERYFESGHLIDPGPDLRLFLAMHGAQYVDFLGLNRTLRFREGIVAPGDRVRVVGKAAWEPTAIVVDGDRH